MFDPKKQVVRMRKGKPVVIDKAILRWRRRLKLTSPLFRKVNNDPGSK